MPRSSITTSPITSSATLRVLEKGALKTGMARLRVASRSTWLVPMQKHPTVISRSAIARASPRSWVRERMPSMWTPCSASPSAAPSSALLRRVTLW